MQVLAIPEKGFQLVVPVSMVAQIIGRRPLSPADLDIPGIAGTMLWNNYKLPLFRTSQLMGGSVSDDDNYRQIVVLWPMKSVGSDSFIALTSLGTPQMVSVGELSESQEEVTKHWTLSYVDLPDGLGVIPDIDALAQSVWKPTSNDHAK